MEQLVKVTQGALAGEESGSRNIQQRNLISDSLRFLNQHEAALVKAYPMALLEIFAEGPSTAKGRSSADDTGMDFGELSLMDDSEMLAQVELSKAQQSALHATDAVLAELNTLVSAAQGLRSVQPERNPLRPESYIRALQQVVGETGVSPETRQLWMQHMRELLGKLLVGEYKNTAKSLRDHGVQPVGYAVLGVPSGGGRSVGQGYGAGSQGNPATGYGPAYSGYGHSMGAPMGDYGNTGYDRSVGPSANWSGDAQQGPLVPTDAAEEALLTVGILRQMLAGGDPFVPAVYGSVPAQPVLMQPVGGAAAWVDQRAGAVSAQSSLSGGYPPSGAASEAIEDMAQLERLVERLASGGNRASQSGGSLAAPLAGWRGPGVAPVVYASMPMEAATQSTAMAVEVVARMMANIAQDARLLPPVQQAVKSLEPALKQLVQHDGQFFTDGAHPARRLLDELTQRSLTFTTETAPGFSRFMRLVTEAVGHLSGNEIKDAAPFGAVLKALQSAWDTQEQQHRVQQEAEEKARSHAEQRELLAERVAADIRKLPDLGRVPVDILDFAAGPWSDVIAMAQVMNGNGGKDDPGGYLALVPVLLWSAQPDLTRHEPDRLNEAIPGLLAKLRKGLKTVNYPAVQTSALLQRLVGLHQEAFEKLTPVIAASVSVDQFASAPAPAPASAQVPVSVDGAEGDSATPSVEQPNPYAEFVIGAWVELVTNGRVVRTQLTWASPHGTLFLFTAADASTQSMTRRMRDKLAREGSLRVVYALPSRVMDSLGQEGRATSNSRLAPLSKSAPLTSSSGPSKSPS